MIGISERAALVSCSGCGIALAVTFLASHSESTGHLVADSLFFLTLFFGQAFLFGFFLADTFFFGFLFPFLFFLFLALLFFFLFLFGFFDCNAFLDVLRYQFFLGCFHLRLRHGRGRSCRFLRGFLSGIFRFESSGCRIHVTEVHQYAAILVRNNGLQYREPQDEQDNQVECYRTRYTVYVIFI